MYTECRHVLPAGLKCTAARVGDSHFCYRHRNLRELMYAPPARPGTPFRMPSLEDSHGCLTAVQQVSWAMGDKRITQKEAGTYLYAITIAKSLLPRRQAVTRKPVRSLCYDNDGFEMAEAVDTCEPPRDCLNCEKTNTCDWFEFYEDEVEILEEQMAEEEEQKKREAQQAENPSAEQEQPAVAEEPKPWKGKYDNERPNVRAIFEMIEAKEYAEMQRLQAEQQARIEAKKEPHPEPEPATRTAVS